MSSPAVHRPLGGLAVLDAARAAGLGPRLGPVRYAATTGRARKGTHASPSPEAYRDLGAQREGERIQGRAFRSRSTTTPDTAPPKQPAPAEPAAPAHRRHNAPAPRQGRGR